MWGLLWFGNDVRSMLRGVTSMVAFARYQGSWMCPDILFLLTMFQKWNGSSFEQSNLKEIGLRVQLGHSDLRCLCPERGHIDFIVIHVNGIHHVNIDFCGCDQRVSHQQQLLWCDWYPATIHFPKTACTRHVLEHFLVLMWSSKILGHEFYTTLECLTDNVGLNVPNVSPPPLLLNWSANIT